VIFVAAKPKYYDVRGGASVSVRKFGSGSYVFHRAQRNFLSTPWDVVVDIVQKRVYVGKGYVNSLEPLIGGEPISGIYPDGTYSGERPFLGLGSGVQAVLLKIKPNAFGNIKSSGPYLASEDSVGLELGGLEEARSRNPVQWIQPIALVSESGKLAQLSCFNYSYKAILRLNGWRHALSAEPVFARSIQDQIATATWGKS